MESLPINKIPHITNFYNAFASAPSEEYSWTAEPNKQYSTQSKYSAEELVIEHNLPNILLQVKLYFK